MKILSGALLLRWIVCIPPKFSYVMPQSSPTPFPAARKIDAIFRDSLFPPKASLLPFCVRAIAFRPDFSAHVLRKLVVLFWPFHLR